MNKYNDNENNIDLSGAFDHPRSAKKPHKDNTPRPLHSQKTSHIIRLVMTHSGGLVKNEDQASYVLLGLVALAVIISLVLVFGGGEVAPIDSITTPDVLPR